MVGGYQIIDLNDCIREEGSSALILLKTIIPTPVNKSIKVLGRGQILGTDVVDSWCYLTIDETSTTLESYPIDFGDDTPVVLKVTISDTILETDSGEPYNTILEVEPYQEK